MWPRKVRDSQCNSQWKGVPLHLGSRKEKLVFEAFKKSHCSYCPLVQHKWINEIEIDKWNWWIFPGSTTMQAHFRNPYTLSIKKSSPNLTSPPNHENTFKSWAWLRSFEEIQDQKIQIAFHGLETGLYCGPQQWTLVSSDISQSLNSYKSTVKH